MIRCFFTEYAEAARFAREGQELALQTRSGRELVSCSYMLAWVVMSLGRISEGMAVLAEARRACERNGLVLYTAMFEDLHGWLQREMGH